MFSIIGVELQKGSLNGIQSNDLHLRVNHLTKAKLILANTRIHVPLKLIIRHLVAFLVLPVALAILLDGVVGEMNDFFPDVVDVELVG